MGLKSRGSAWTLNLWIQNPEILRHQNYRLGMKWIIHKNSKWQYRQKKYICRSGITNYTLYNQWRTCCHLNIWRHWMFDTDKYVLVVCVTVQWSVQDWGVILFWQIVYSPPSNYQQLHRSRILNINIWTRTKTQTQVCPSVSVQFQFCFRSNPIPNNTKGL